MQALVNDGMAQAVTGETLVVSLRLTVDGPEIARELVTPADLSDACGEAWLNAALRRGQPEVRFADMRMTVVHGASAAKSPSSAAFAIEAMDPAGRVERVEFTPLALEHTADRAAQKLIAAGVLQSSSLYYFRVQKLPGGESPVDGLRDETALTIRVRSADLKFLRVPWKKLAARSKVAGPLRTEDYPVFFTREALEKSEAFARKGGSATPSVETGSVLCGNLWSCPETGEFGCVVNDAIEVFDAEKKPLTLSYTGQTWARIAAVMRARQNQPATATQRIVGQSHGHNFLPMNGAAPCEACAQAPTCNRTSVFVSSDDRRFSRAVFHQQPWHLCQIFGLNARNEKVGALFGLIGGRLRERGYYVLEEFDSTEWA